MMPSEAVSDQMLSSKNKRKMAVGDKPAPKKMGPKLNAKEKATKKDGKGKGSSNHDNEA